MMEGMIGKKKGINPAQAQARKDKEKEIKKSKKEQKKSKEVSISFPCLMILGEFHRLNFLFIALGNGNSQ